MASLCLSLHQTLNPLAAPGGRPLSLSFPRSTTVSTRPLSRRATGVRTSRASYSPTPATERVISIASYALPFFNSLQYGRFLFAQYPRLGLLFEPIFPILNLYRSVPYASFVAFFGLYLGVVRNTSLSKYVRFNAMQAVTLDVLLAVPVLLTRILDPGQGGGFGMKAMMWGHTGVFVFSFMCFVYGVVSCLVGKTPYIPFVADAADCLPATLVIFSPLSDYLLPKTLVSISPGGGTLATLLTSPKGPQMKVLLDTHGGHHHGIDMSHPVLALTVTIASISVKEGLFWITKRAGEKQGSGLMMANAWHHRSDAISSVVALVGVGGSIFGVKFLDPLAGLVVSAMIFKAGLETGHQSVLELVDAAIPAQQLEPIRQTILQVEGVKGCHRLRGRRAGSSLYLDVHIVVDPFSSVSVAHEVGEYVRGQINKNHPEVSEVFIHIDPAFLQFSCSMMEHDGITNESNQESNICQEIKNVEAAVSDIFLSQFHEKMTIKRVTPHLLHSKILLQIVVSMPSTMTIQDAMRAAEDAEKEILKASPNVARVSIQLSLKNSVPQ